MKKQLFSKRWWNQFLNSPNKPPIKNLTASLWAIGLGLLIAALVIWTKGVNPWTFIADLFQGSYQQLPQFLLQIAIMTCAGCAVGISFKAGLFNLAISGQMMAGGMVALWYLFIIKKGLGGYLLVSLCFAILVSGGVGLIIGALKVFFRVHEVLSSIMINWIIFYLGKYTFGPETTFTNETTTASKILENYLNSSQIPINQWIKAENNYWIFFLFAVVLMLMLGLLYSKKTTWGYKIRLMGSNSYAAAYAGVHQGWFIIKTLGLCGILAGIGGWIHYLVLSGGVYTIGSSPIQEGFDGIAIALLGYNNPIAVFFAATFFSTLQPGFDLLQLNNVPQSFQKIISGLIVYFSALTLLFHKLEPWKFIKQFCYLQTNQDYRELLRAYRYKKFICFRDYWQSRLKFHLFPRNLVLTKNKIKLVKKQLANSWKEQLPTKNYLVVATSSPNLPTKRKALLKELDLLTLKANNKFQKNYYHQTKQLLKIEHQKQMKKILAQKKNHQKG